MKGGLIIGVAIGMLVVVAGGGLPFFFATPIPEVAQSDRCSVMCDRRDAGTLRIPKNATKVEVLKLLGEPQNTDPESDVWIWLFDWDDYVDSGAERDWLTMSESSGDGLWIGFDETGLVRTPLWSLSAATP